MRYDEVGQVLEYLLGQRMEEQFYQEKSKSLTNATLPPPPDSANQSRHAQQAQSRPEEAQRWEEARPLLFACFACMTKEEGVIYLALLQKSRERLNQPFD